MFTENDLISNHSVSFLDVSKQPKSSLRHLFTEPSNYIPKWELSSRNAAPQQISSTSNLPQVNSFFQKIKSGSQDQCDGFIDFSLAEDFCDALNDLKENTNIAFSKDRLVEYLTGGTCSAMSFQFADDYLKNKSYAPEEEVVHQLAEKYKHSGQTFRTVQAAFNTLHRDSRYPSEDFMCDKVASMLRFYDRYVADASELFYMESCSTEEEAAALESIESFLNQFEEGVFVVRCILMDDNDKGERYGHTTLYIKTPHQHFFFDPDEGTYKLANGDEALMRVIKRMMYKSAVPFGRIYKIQE